MMTPEQNKEIIDFLQSKNLPLDLLVEVDDHMKEQISGLMDEGISFEEAFKQTKFNWQKDLEMRFAVFRGKRTKLERDAFRETDRNKNWTTLKIILPYIFITVLATIYYPILGKYLIIGANLIIGVYCTYLMIANNKLFKSASGNSNKRNISILQRRVSFLVIGAQCLYLIFLINSSFQKFHSAIINFPRIDFNHFIVLFFQFLYVYAGILGILYFKDYKKTVEILKRKIDFKL